MQAAKHDKQQGTNGAGFFPGCTLLSARGKLNFLRLGSRFLNATSGPVVIAKMEQVIATEKGGFSLTLRVEKTLRGRHPKRFRSNAIGATGLGHYARHWALSASNRRPTREYSPAWVRRIVLVAFGESWIWTTPRRQRIFPGP